LVDAATGKQFSSIAPCALIQVKRLCDILALDLIKQWPHFPRRIPLPGARISCKPRMAQVTGCGSLRRKRLVPVCLWHPTYDAHRAGHLHVRCRSTV